MSYKDLEPLLYESAYQWIRPILYFAETVPVSYTLPLQTVPDPYWTVI